jgi:hypothetical protein
VFLEKFLEKMKLTTPIPARLSEIHPVWVKRVLGISIAITILIFLINFIFVGFGVFGDGMGYYAPLRSLWFDGDLKVTNEYDFFANSVSKFGGTPRTTDPLPEYSKYTIGLGLILSPFYFLGHLTASGLNILGIDVETNGLSWSYEFFYCLGSVALGITGLIIAYRAARHYFSRFASLVAVVGVWFATPLTFYLTLETSMSHAVSQFLMSLFLFVCVVRPWLNDHRQQLLLGLILGLGTLVRPQDFLFIIVPIVFGLHGQLKPLLNKNYLKAIVLIISIALLLQIPQVFVYLWQYGKVEYIPYLREGSDLGYQASFNWFNPQLSKVLFSGYRGLMTWHPLILLAVIGLVILTCKLPILGSSLLAGFVVQLYLISAWWSWWQGASFGSRMFSNCSFIFVFGLAALWDYFRIRQWQRAAIALTGFFMAWNVLLVMQYESGMIPAETAISLVELYRNQLSVIPYFLNHVFNR